MNQCDRDQIQKNIIALSKLENVPEIAERLIGKGVIDQEFYDRIKYQSKPRGQKDENQDFFLMLLKRGPNAFSTLVEILYETGRISEAKLLDSPNLQENRKQFNAIHPRSLSLGSESPQSPSLEESFSGSENSNGSNTGVITFAFETSEASSSTSSVQTGSCGGCFSTLRPSTSEIVKEFGLENATAATAQILQSLSIVRDGSPLITTPFKETTLYNQGDPEAYPMMSRPRGYALIINNITFDSDPESFRHGAHHDTENLFQLFEDLGFEVTVRHDATRNDFMNPNNGIIKRFTNQFSNSQPVDACVVAIMSHGLKGSRIRTADPGNVNLDLIEDIVEQFNNKHCPALIDKPRIFIVQACRGDSRDKGIRRTQTDGRNMTFGNQIGHGHQAAHSTDENLVPTLEDMIICYSCVPGYVSNRDTETGTWYINLFCQVLREHAHKKEFTAMLQQIGIKLRVINSEKGEKQMSAFENIGLNRKLYFNPGLYI